jgi:hypothetical protein
MSVAEKINSEETKPKKNNNGLLVANPVYKPLDIHGVMTLG